MVYTKILSNVLMSVVKPPGDASPAVITMRLNALKLGGAIGVSKCKKIAETDASTTKNSATILAERRSSDDGIHGKPETNLDGNL